MILPLLPILRVFTNLEGPQLFCQPLQMPVYLLHEPSPQLTTIEHNCITPPVVDEVLPFVI